jgi:RimJ/RimL family protein N-acetyltransferase
MPNAILLPSPFWTKNFALERLEHTDLEALAAFYAANPEALRSSSPNSNLDGPPKSIANAEIKDSDSRFLTGRGCFYGVRRKAAVPKSGQLAGVVHVTNTTVVARDWPLDVVELGLILGSEFQRQGYGSELFCAVTHHVFNKQPDSLVALLVKQENEASRKTAAGLGFLPLDPTPDAHGTLIYTMGNVSQMPAKFRPDTPGL